MRSMHVFSKGSLRLSITVVVFLFSVFAVSLIGERIAAAEDGGMCIPVHAKIQSTFFAEGCNSPVGLCTTGEITEGGLLNGSTSFVALGMSPAAGMPGVEPDTTLSYSGLLKITTRLGMLTILDVGVFDTARGVFSELDRITEGTERLFGASGTLFIYGTAFADGTGFGGSIRGEVCLAH
jgi:hypothetical protein